MAGAEITELMNRYGNAISRLCRSYESNNEQAKELNQEYMGQYLEKFKIF